MQFFTYVLLGIFAVAFTTAAPMEGDKPFKLSNAQAQPILPRGNINGNVTGNSGNSGGAVVGIGNVNGGGGAVGGVGGNAGSVGNVAGSGNSVQNGGGSSNRNSGKISGGNVRIGRVG
ncbi:hypothetical protein ONZ45_g1828 [Pleurotus djamor]|nr:hypothetical protein ONZ45_g1828 [Pleurotus djamor]